MPLTYGGRYSVAKRIRNFSGLCGTRGAVKKRETRRNASMVDIRVVKSRTRGWKKKGREFTKEGTKSIEEFI
jgi:hypothetical protein